MKKVESISIGDAMRQLIDEAQMAGKLDELRAADNWPLVVGAEIARRSPRPVVRAGVMYVSVADAALRNELHLNRTRLRQALNSIMGREVIRDLRFVS